VGYVSSFAQNKQQQQHQQLQAQASAYWTNFLAD
jgi:hypothetical protein